MSSYKSTSEALLVDAVLMRPQRVLKCCYVATLFQFGVVRFTASAIASFRLMLKSVLRQVARQRGVRQQHQAMYEQSVFESSCASRLSIPHDAVLLVVLSTFGCLSVFAAFAAHARPMQ